MWHASVANRGGKNFGKKDLRRFAIGCLAGVGSLLDGRQFEEWTGYAYHVRRRLTHEEQQQIGDALDCRGTDEGRRRFQAVQLTIPAVAVEMAYMEIGP